MRPQPVKHNRENVNDKHTVTATTKILGIAQVKKERKIKSEVFVVMELQAANLN
jgi:hypothetical protein